MGTVIVNPQVTTGQISLEMPSKVYGLSKSMFMGRADTLKNYRVLMEFPISMIPDHCTILKAALKIYVQFAGTRILSPFTPHGVKEPWSPLTLNWNNQPSFYSQISGEPLSLGREGFYSFNITKLVSKWYQQEIPNYGLIIKNNEVEKGTLKRITTIPNSALGPSAEITYCPKCSNQIISTRYVSEVEELDTNEFYSFSTAIDTSLTSTITYHVENLGNSPVEMLLQVSPNLLDFMNDSPTPQIIGPHEMVYAIPYTFSKYLRIAAKTLHPGETSRLKIWYQAQEG